MRKCIIRSRQLTAFCLALAIVLALIPCLSMSASADATAYRTLPPEGDYYIVPEDYQNSYAIDVCGGGNAPECTKIHIWSRNETDAQIWTLSRVGNSYLIIHKRTGLVLNLQNGNQGLSGRLWLYHNDGTDACYWTFYCMSDNPSSYVIRSNCGGKVLDLDNNNPFDGALLHTWDFHGGASCRWRLVPVSNNNDDLANRISHFIGDSRWRNGVSWGYSQRPKLSSYSSKGCCAYAADFAKYVHQKNSPRAGTIFYSASEIRAGDILYVTPQHWMCVVSRNGNTVRIAHGNWNSKVVVSNYTLSGNRIAGKTFAYGYHF